MRSSPHAPPNFFRWATASENGSETMRNKLRKIGLAAAMIIAVAGTTVATPETANARWGGGWHGGGWHGGGWRGGGWGWGGFGWGGWGPGFRGGLRLGASAAYGASPYYG